MWHQAQRGVHERPEGTLAYERHVHEWVLRCGPVRLGVGFYRYTSEHGRPSGRRELNMSVSWMGPPLLAQGFPADAPPNGGREHA